MKTRTIEHDDTLYRLARSEQLLAEAQRLTQLGSWDWDVASDTVTWSDELYRIFGKPPRAEPPTFRSYVAQVHPDDRATVVAAIERAVATGGGFDHRERIVRADGEIRVLHSRGRAIRGLSGKVVKLVGTCRDVTDEQRLLEQMNRMQRIDAIGQLAGGIAHDFNNLLTIVIAHCELLLRRAHDPGAVRAGLVEIRGAAESAASMSRQLLTFARGDLAPIAVVDLGEAIRQSERLLARALGEAIRLELDLAPVGRVRCNPSQLEQVLLNLTVNARDASRPGSRVIVRARRDGDRARVDVVDEGAGMAPEVAARAFEPFFTTKPSGQGTGLGLSTVHGIVRRLGGEVTIASAPGAGTTISLLLPCTDEPIELRAVPAPASAPTGPAHVLVVEDHPGVRDALGTILDEAGYRTTAVADAQAALTALDQARPSLVLVDLGLPDLDGRELAALIRHRHPGVPIVLMSGYPRHPSAADVEVEGVLHKPLAPDAVLRAVRAALSG